MVSSEWLWVIQKKEAEPMKPIKKPSYHDLVQKIINSTGKERESLIKILKNKYPDVKVPK